MDKENTINDFIAIVRRKIWILIGVASIIFIPTAIITFLLPSVYEAETTIMYKSSTESSVMGKLTFISQNTSIPNLIEEVRSRSLSEEVALQLPPNIKNQFHIKPNHNSNANKNEIIGGIIKKNISISSVRGTDILKIKFQFSSPEVAAYVANKIVSVLQQRDIEAKKGEIIGVKDFIEHQLSIFTKKLQQSEEDLKRFKEKYGEFKVDTLGNIGGRTLQGATDVETAYNEARTDRGAAESRLKYIQNEIAKLNKDIAKTSSALSQSNALSALKENLMSLQFQYQTLLLKGYDKSHPEVLRLQSEIDKARSKYKNALLQATEKLNIVDPYSRLQVLVTKSIETQTDIASYKAKEKALKKIMADYNKKLSKLPAKELQFARLIRMKDVNEKIYKMLLEKNEEVRISEAGKVANIRVIDPAIPPASPIKPKKKKNLAVALILSLILGFGAAFAAEAMDTTIKGIDEVENLLKSPALSSIPTIKANKDKTEEEAIEKRLITHYQPRSPISEAYRTLRTNLQFSKVDDGHIKTVVITSPAPREGKTLTASNLAITEAQSGLKTLLLDADLRKPMIHNLFGLDKTEGLSKVLIGELNLKDAIKSTEIENLYVVTSGPVPPNPSELLGSKRMKEVLKTLKEKFDIIIMDSPPMIAVTDAVVLSQNADGTILIIRSAKTSREIAERCIQNAQYAKIRLLGCVLNDVNVRNVYGKYDYYYYNYYYYYSDEEGKKKKRKHHR